MADNNKISIEVEINASGQQQINQYKNAFDGLRTSINNLSNPISKLDGDIVKLTESLKKAGEQNNIVSDTINKFGKANNDAKTAVDLFNTALGFLKNGVISFESAVTGGLTLLLAYAPEIIKWVGEVIKGDKHVSTFNQTLRDHKIVMEAVNVARLKGTQDAQQELTHLKLLYTASQDHNLKLSERKKIVTELQNQYPDYFGKLSSEAILTGKAAKVYDNLTKSILATSRARAAENLLVKNQEQKLGNEDKVSKLTSDLKKYNDQLAQAKKAQDIVNKSFDAFGGGNSADKKTKELASKFFGIKDQRDAIQKMIDDLNGKSKLLDTQNDILAKSVIDNIEKNGARTLGVVSNGTNFNRPKKQAVVDDKPRGGVDLEAKSPGVNFDFDTNKSEKQKQQDLNALNALDPKMNPEVKKTQATQEEIDKIEEFYAKKKADREDALANAKIHAGDRFIDAALKNSKKDSAIYKAAFLAKKATSIADTIISTKRAVMESFKAYAGIPFVGQALGIIQAVFMAGQGAMSIAEIASKTFWPNNARLAISISLQFEAGGQPISGATGLIPEPIKKGYPDLATNSYFDYGVQEGIPRLLNLFDKHGIKVTSFMVGQAVDKNPELAREIVKRGHEAAAHGKEWSWQYHLSKNEERKWIKSVKDSIEKATGQIPTGYDCYWMRGSVHTLSLLQELGFMYHNNDLSRDEPYVQDLNGKPFVTMPYTIHMNDIGSYDFAGFSPQDYEQQIKDEFDQLYEEGADRRRMMLISLHDRISGHASRVRVFERFLNYVKKHEGVWFARKDELAKYALSTPEITPNVVRDVAEKSGLAGNTNL